MDMDVLKRRLPKVLLRIIVIAICFIGSFIQVNEVSNRYFKYKTKTTVSVDIPSTIEFPILSTCWRFNDLLDFAAIERDFKIKLKRWSDEGFDWRIFQQETRRFKVSDWFKYTPQIENILEPSFGCRIRLPNVYATSELSGKECMNYFNVTKYIWTDYMCYQFDPIITDKIKVYQYTMVPIAPDLVYQIFFDLKHFSTIKKVSHAIHMSDSSYMYDSVFSKSKFRSFDGHPSSDVSYRELERHNKEPPYEPLCNPYMNKYGSANEAQFLIFNEKFKEEYNMITPFVRTYDTHSDNYMPSYLDFVNKTFRNMFEDSLNGVRNLGFACKFKVFETRIGLNSENELSASVFWPLSEATRITYVPDQELIDFVVYVCSCIGIWFGLSFYSLYDGIITFHKILTKRSRTNSIPTVSTERNQSFCRRCNQSPIHRCNCVRIQKLNLKVNLLQNLVKQLLEMNELIH